MASKRTERLFIMGHAINAILSNPNHGAWENEYIVEVAGDLAALALKELDEMDLPEDDCDDGAV